RGRVLRRMRPPGRCPTGGRTRLPCSSLAFEVQADADLIRVEFVEHISQRCGGVPARSAEFMKTSAHDGDQSQLELESVDGSPPLRCLETGDERRVRELVGIVD